jgi:hypothetical protein
VLRSFVVLALLALSPRAFAHQTSVKYVDLVLEGERVTVTLKHAASDVTEPMGLPNDARPTVREALAHAAVPPHVQGWFVLAGCTNDAARAAAVDDRFLTVSWTATCANTDELAVDLAALFALDARQEVIVQLAAPGRATVQAIVRGDSPKVTLRPGEAPSLLAWVRSGMDHIYEGVDHILFVLALLLVVMIYRARPSESGALHPGRAGASESSALHPGRGHDRWHTRAFWPTLRATALIVTAFTIAHSITLIAASLGVVSLPSAFVEAVIALSIAYTAAENVVRPDVRWRYALTFGFGLIHGLGFASVLAELLPPSDVVVPLLMFNVGVEVGQLSIVMIALPVFYGVARVVGGDRYRRVALPALAGVIFLVGLAMFAERVLDVRILPM